MGHSAKEAFAVWITGLPASGKSTLASAVARQLGERGVNVTVLESDALRTLFSKTPRYDEHAREYFYGSIAFIGRVLTEHGISVIFDATANRRRYRDRARQQIPKFIEVFVECPLEVCVQRDPKGIYRQAREGSASHVPGTQVPYESPKNPDIVIRGDRDEPEEASRRVIDLLARKAFLAGRHFGRSRAR